MVYYEIQAAYIGLGMMGYFSIKCQPNNIIMSASVFLAICMFCICVFMCESTIRLTHSRKQVGGHLNQTAIFNFIF